MTNFTLIIVIFLSISLGAIVVLLFYRICLKKVIDTNDYRRMSIPEKLQKVKETASIKNISFHSKLSILHIAKIAICVMCVLIAVDCAFMLFSISFESDIVNGLLYCIASLILYDLLNIAGEKIFSRTMLLDKVR